MRGMAVASVTVTARFVPARTRALPRTARVVGSTTTTCPGPEPSTTSSTVTVRPPPPGPGTSTSASASRTSGTTGAAPPVAGAVGLAEGVGVPDDAELLRTIGPSGDSGGGAVPHAPSARAATAAIAAGRWGRPHGSILDDEL